MTNAQFSRYIIKGHELYWDMLGNMRGNQHHRGSLSWLSGDICYNYKAVLTGSDYERQIDEIISRIIDRQIPDNLIITPDSAPSDVDICNLLLDKGFHVDRINSGMAKLLNEGKSNPLCSKDINLFRVNNTYQLKISGAILNTSFEYDLFSFDHYLDAYNDSRVRFYMAECSGIPAGACMAIYEHDFVEIAWVGTINGYRKKGIAGYLMNMVEKDALDRHVNISVLSAYSNALNAYRRVGYKEYCEFKVLRYQLQNREGK